MVCLIAVLQTLMWISLISSTHNGDILRKWWIFWSILPAKGAASFFLGLNVFLVRDLFNVLFLKIKHTFIIYFHQWNNLIVKIKILGTKNHLCGWHKILKKRKIKKGNWYIWSMKFSDGWKAHEWKDQQPGIGQLGLGIIQGGWTVEAHGGKRIW